MLELTRKRTTAGWTDLCLSVPDAEADDVAVALRELLHAFGYAVRGDLDDDVTYPASEVFPDSTPGKRLRGLRAREDITQAEMADRLGLRKHLSSVMESVNRPITREMSKLIGAEFDISYNALL